MPVTQQDLLEWTQEYRDERELNPLVGDFNDWLKERILWKEQHDDHAQLIGLPGTRTSTHIPAEAPVPSHDAHASSRTHNTSAHASDHHSSSRSAHSPATRRRSSRTQLSPHTTSNGLPAQTRTPSRSQTSPRMPQGHLSSPSPPLITPGQQLHVQPHSHPTTPVLHPVPSTLRSPTPQSDVPTMPPRRSPSPAQFSHTHSHSSTPILHPVHTTRHSPQSSLPMPSRRSPSPESFPHSPMAPLPQYLQKKDSKTKTIKRGLVSPPRAALFRSLSQSLIFPHAPHHQLTRVDTYDYPFDMDPPPSADITELKNYITQFQSKQQNQLFQIFDIVEKINSKLAGGPPHSSPIHSPYTSPTHPPHSSLSRSPHSSHLRKYSPKAKQGRIVPKKKEPSPFVAIFSDQVNRDCEEGGEGNEG